MPSSQSPESPPTPEELVTALPDLFYVATQCTGYHYAFATLFPAAAATGAEVHPSRDQRLMLNAISEATLMFVRKSAEFFKPREAGDKADTVYSYCYPGYTRQEWIIPRETYREFHKRVGHITIREARYGKMEWPVFPLAMQAMRKWTEFFTTAASAYAPANARAAGLCTEYATALTTVAAMMERDVSPAEKLAKGTSAPASGPLASNTSSGVTTAPNPNVNLQNEFATVDAVIRSAAETHAVDAFALSVIKHERQLRKLFTYSIFQFPCFGYADVNALRQALASNTRVYADGFVAGLDRLWPKTISTLVGARYIPLTLSLGRAKDARNKIFHGQITKVGLDRTTLLALVADIQEWCGLLATAAQHEVGYDGFARDSYRKAEKTDLHLYFVHPLGSIAEYQQFIARYVARP